jgi:hypothetical protein
MLVLPDIAEVAQTPLRFAADYPMSRNSGDVKKVSEARTLAATLASSQTNPRDKATVFAGSFCFYLLQYDAFPERGQLCVARVMVSTLELNGLQLSKTADFSNLKLQFTEIEAGTLTREAFVKHLKSQLQ